MNYKKLKHKLTYALDYAEHNVRAYSSCTDGSRELCEYEADRIRRVYEKVLKRLGEI